MKLKKLLIAFYCLLTISVFAKDREIDSTTGRIKLKALGLDQDGKISLVSDMIVPANTTAEAYNSKNSNYNSNCYVSFTESSNRLRIIKKGTTFNVVKIEGSYGGGGNIFIYFSANDKAKGIDHLLCDGDMTGEQFNYIFNGILKITFPEPMEIGAAIKIPKSKTAMKITANEVVQTLPKACVYIGLWKEKDQLPNLSQSAKDYLDTLIPILRGTFKSLNNIECEKISTEALAEAAMKLSEDKTVNDGSRGNAKVKNSKNGKASGSKSKNM